jgi:deazaflavin-dependent oxidoreductase (nitroreductase family)
MDMRVRIAWRSGTCRAQSQQPLRQRVWGTQCETRKETPRTGLPGRAERRPSSVEKRVQIAFNYGGDKDPQWYYNLKAPPECEFGGEQFVASQVADQDEYERLFRLAEQVFAGYADYRERAGGQIPIFRLKAR